MEQFHQANDLIISLGQIIACLPAAGRRALRARIYGDLGKAGLRSLFNECRVATAISKENADVTFFDLERHGRFDFLACRDDFEWEVEVKSANIFSGAPIYPHGLQVFHQELNRRFISPSVSTIPVVEIAIGGRLPVETARVREMVDACSHVVRSRDGLQISADLSVSFAGTLPQMPMSDLNRLAREIAHQQGGGVCVKMREPRVFVKLRSKRQSKLIENISGNISDAAKRQLSATRPGVVWTHIDYISPEDFQRLTLGNGIDSHTNRVVNSFFNSEKRRHLRQLVFSGGERLHLEGDIKRSSFERRTYNAFACSLDTPPLISRGSEREPAA